MTKFGLRARHLLPLGALLGCLSSAVAAPAKTDEQDTGSAVPVEAIIAKTFVLSKELQLDPDLRAEADKISAAHLARIKQLVPVWLQEERRLQTGADNGANARRALYSVLARLLNESAQWQIEPGDAAYEQATLDVLKTSPLVCRSGGDAHFHDFSSRIVRIQAMPPERRQAALETERRLLEHWGKPRPAVEPWPNPLPQDAAVAAVARIRAGGARPPVALPPSLASSVLAKGIEYKDLALEARCALQRWWLTVSLAQGETPAKALSAFRYGTMLTAAERYGGTFDRDDEQASNGPTTPAMPGLADIFRVSGVTKMRRQLDAAGKPEQATVIERNITVPGIRGARPVAFETVFDAAAVRYALKGGDPAKPGDSKVQVFDMVWKSSEPDVTSKARGAAK